MSPFKCRKPPSAGDSNNAALLCMLKKSLFGGVRRPKPPRRPKHEARRGNESHRSVVVADSLQLSRQQGQANTVPGRQRLGHRGQRLMVSDDDGPSTHVHPLSQAAEALSFPGLQDSANIEPFLPGPAAMASSRIFNATLAAPPPATLMPTQPNPYEHPRTNYAILLTGPSQRQHAIVGAVDASCEQSFLTPRIAAQLQCVPEQLPPGKFSRPLQTPAGLVAPRLFVSDVFIQSDLLQIPRTKITILLLPFDWQAAEMVIGWPLMNLIMSQSPQLAEPQTTSIMSRQKNQQQAEPQLALSNGSVF